MSSRGPKMRPKWLPGGLRGGPWRPLGGPGARRANFERCWVPFGRPFGTQKSLKSELKLSLKSSSASERHFGPLGAVFRSMLGSFWGRLGLCVAARWPNTKTLIFDDPLTRNLVFSGPWGVPTSVQNRFLERLGAGPGSEGVLEASWARFLLPFGTPKRTPKRSRKQAEI